MVCYCMSHMLLTVLCVYLVGYRNVPYATYCGVYVSRMLSACSIMLLTVLCICLACYRMSHMLLTVLCIYIVCYRHVPYVTYYTVIYLVCYRMSHMMLLACPISYLLYNGSILYFIGMSQRCDSELITFLFTLPPLLLSPPGECRLLSSLIAAPSDHRPSSSECWSFALPCSECSPLVLVSSENSSLLLLSSRRGLPSNEAGSMVLPFNECLVLASREWWGLVLIYSGCDVPCNESCSLVPATIVCSSIVLPSIE